VNGVRFPEGFRLEVLRREHPRRSFESGETAVDDWLHTKALQQQKKHLSVTKVLLDPAGLIGGYYTVASGQVDFGDLPADIVRTLPRRALPVAVVAWLGVAKTLQGQGIGKRLLMQALRDCFEAGKTFAFIAVILDCLNDNAKAFYQQFEFRETPGHPYRLFLSAARLESIIER
jgi:GNAT superfamily N-acetyltransferase